MNYLLFKNICHKATRQRKTSKTPFSMDVSKDIAPRYISHIKTDADGTLSFQSNEDHSQGVASLAQEFAAEFGMGDWGRILGLLHDKGKEKSEFQNYIRYENHLTTDRRFSQEGKAHAYVGGLIAKAQYAGFGYSLIGNPIMGHHRGLYDYTDLENEEAKAIPPEVSMPDLEKVALPSWFRPGNLQPKDFHHIERMLYSCLVDADFLDTERFMQPEQYGKRGSKTPLADLLANLDRYLSQFGEPTTEVNKIRAEVQRACRDKADGAPGFYSLTVPTGGGKTLSSLVWALKHAVKHGKRRIVIAIPYTSIIVQTAAILRSIFGEENVLEHHSNVTIDENNPGRYAEQLKLATENWDYPIIVTTNVQLFESMMASHASDCRKLHNLCNSVLILDEVQTLPTDFLQPIVDTLDTYQRLFGLSVLFTTASQPVLEGEHQGVNPRTMLHGLSHIEEIVPPGANLHDRLRRVQLDIDDTPKSYDEVARQLAQHDRVLCIVNTRRDAKELFAKLPQEGVRIHLSRMMCPKHVSQQIERMKEALKDPANKVVRVVSTQLVEAGVDIDFPVVYRQEAGLDSVLQAAGRCNREGKLPLSTTYVFSLAKEHALPRGFITQCNNARTNMVGPHDWFSPEAMNEYFLQLYSRIKSFDAKDMNSYLYTPQELMLETAAREFRLIDDATTPVVVNWGGSSELISQLRQHGPSYSLMKKLSQYSVNLRKGDFGKMLESGSVEEVVEGFYWSPTQTMYSDSIGLMTESEETWII